MAGIKKIGWLFGVLMTIALAKPCFAQFGGAPGARGGAQFDQLKLDLGATDDEWPALQVKVQKVVDAQNANSIVTFGGEGAFTGAAGRGARSGRAGGRRGGAPAAVPAPPSAVQTALNDLKTTLANSKASTDVIKVKLDTLRQARAKAVDELTAAQAELKAIVSPRQEAVLVVNGLLN